MRVCAVVSLPEPYQNETDIVVTIEDGAIGDDKTIQVFALGRAP